MNAGLAWGVFLVGSVLSFVVVAWITLIYIDVNHDWHRRDVEAPRHDTHRGLGKVIYDAMWRRRDRRALEMEDRRRRGLINWSKGRRP